MCAENAFYIHEQWAFALHVHVLGDWGGGRRWSGGRGERSETPNKFSGKQTMPNPVHGNTLKNFGSREETPRRSRRKHNRSKIFCTKFKYDYDSVCWDTTEWLRVFDMFSANAHTHTRYEWRKFVQWSLSASVDLRYFPIWNSSFGPQVGDGNDGEFLLHEKNYSKINSFRRRTERGWKEKKNWK